MIKTSYLRHVWRTINDGNGDIKVLALEQWVIFSENHPAEGHWEEVNISTSEPDDPPVL